MKKILLLVLFCGLSVVVGIAGMYLMNLSIRLDEAQSLWISTKPVSTILFFIAQDVHVPLYSLLLHFWVQIFGNDIVVARLLSFLFFLLTLPTLYVVSKEVGNKKIALLTVILFALSPFILWYSSEARMYTLFTFVTSLNHLFFQRMVKSSGKTGKFGYLISTVIGFYSHYFFMFLIATQIFYIVYRLVSHTQKNNKSIFQIFLIYKFPFVWRYVTLLFTAFLFFTPWLIYVVSLGSASNTQPLIPPPNEYNIFQTFVNFIFGFQSQAIQAILISLWPLAVVSLFFIFTKRNRTPIVAPGYFILATFLPIILVFVVSYIRPIFLPRYLILVTPTLFFLISWLILNNSRKIASILSVWMIISMMGLMFYQSISEKTPVKENYSGVSTYLADTATPQDVIAVSAPFTVYPIEYSYKGITRITTIPEWDRYQEGSIPAFSQENMKIQIEQYSQNYSRIFVVLSYDQGYEDDIVDYFDGSYELLEKKDFSPELEVRVYKLRYDIKV
jgi:uncharacterized membrane protein